MANEVGCFRGKIGKLLGLPDICPAINRPSQRWLTLGPSASAGANLKGSTAGNWNEAYDR
jgi:hypothetical protein